MNYFTLGILCLALALQISAEDTEARGLTNFARSNVDFSREFFKTLFKRNGNFVASPLSAQMVLSMAYLGAAGVTAQEMRSGLALPEDIELVKEAFHSAMNKLKTSDKVDLEVANRMFLRKGIQVDADFVNNLHSTFGSFVGTANFSDPKTRVQINKWVQDATHSRIKELIPDGVLSELTELLLINAVYFRGVWQYPFNPTRTQPKPFYTDENNQIQTQFMWQTAYLGHAKLDNLDAQIIELYYQSNNRSFEDGAHSLVILLPNKRNGLRELERNMRSIDVRSLIASCNRNLIELTLPKFRIETAINLNDFLKEMGMASMFSGQADFSGITRDGLHVSHVLQKTFIEVSEEGTEATSATATAGIPLSGTLVYVPPPKVKVDRPFLFYLVGLPRSEDSYVLFGGRVVRP